MSELRSLLWLEGKRVGAVVDYVLRIFGVPQDSSRFYAIYVMALLVLWMFTAWAYLTEQLEFISRSVSADSIATLSPNIPIIIIVAQLIFLIFALRESPLKMSAPDLAFLATSPMRRSLIVVVYWLKTSTPFAILIGTAAALIMMFATFIENQDLAGIAGGWSFVVTAALIWISGAVVWSIALLKLHLPIQRYRIWFWLIPLLFIVLIIFVPQPFMLMGELWLHTLNAQFTMNDRIILLTLVISSTVLLMLSGAGIHLSVMADESQRYARIKRIGILGQVYARDVISRINRQTQLSNRSSRHVTLPLTQSRFNTLWHRAFLTLIRLAPMSFLKLLFVGVRYTVVIAGSILLFGWQAPQVWLIVAVMLLQFRPTALIEPFQQTMELAFVRQFLPLQDSQSIILADSIIPLLIATSGGWVVLLLLPLNIAAFLLVPAGLTILMLCQALTWFKPTAFGGQRIAYEYSTFASGLVVIGAGYFTGDLWAALLASGFVMWTLVGLIRDSRSN